jgi:7-cyano-7-deazaguanine synthase
MIRIGLDIDVGVTAPLLDMKKSEIAEMGQKVGANEALKWSHTCYHGVYPPCGECPACVIRKAGFDEAGLVDPLTEVV